MWGILTGKKYTPDNVELHFTIELRDYKNDVFGKRVDWHPWDVPRNSAEIIPINVIEWDDVEEPAHFKTSYTIYKIRNYDSPI